MLSGLMVVPSRLVVVSSHYCQPLMVVPSRLVVVSSHYCQPLSFDGHTTSPKPVSLLRFEDFISPTKTFAEIINTTPGHAVIISLWSSYAL